MEPMDHDELVKVTQKIVRGGVRRAGLRQDATDDLVQDVLFKYLKAWPGPDAPDNPAAWLQRAANNAVIDYLREGQRRPADNFAPDGDDPLSLLMATLRAAGTPSLVVVADTVWQDALALVSDQDADLLRRRFMDAVPAADLAAEYGVSRAADRSADGAGQEAHAGRLGEAARSGHGAAVSAPAHLPKRPRGPSLTGEDWRAADSL